MNQIHRFHWVVSAFLLVALLHSPASATESISKAKYITGGLVGSGLGLGIGHAIQGRYGSRGWIFSLADGAGYGMLFGGIASVNQTPTCAPGTTCSTDRSTGATLIIIGSLALLAVRAWQMGDLWTVPKVKGWDAAVKTISTAQRKKDSSFTLTPFLFESKFGLGMAGRF